VTVTTRPLARPSFRTQPALMAYHVVEDTPSAPASPVSMAELEAALAAHLPRMTAVARRYFRCEADCADAVQDACLAAVRHLDQFRGQSALSTWLHRIVVNACLMKRRSLSRQHDVPWDDARVANAVDETDHNDSLDREEARQKVRAALTQLSSSQRTVIQLRYLEGFSTEETAELLGTSSGAVKARLHRSCRVLRQIMQSQGAQ
jgi:RNA polymerase sigma-70 factor (ECF subfamily)